MSELIDYWPPRDQAIECLRTEAETIDEALLLAVHEPVPLLRRPANRDREPVWATEDDLLCELLRPSGDGSSVLVAITGASGVGKSHMVRWLRAQLQRHPRRDEFVIVSIPKTASLRQVVELILAPLPEKQYAALRHELAGVTDALDPLEAADMLAVALTHELMRLADGLKAEVQAGRASAAEHGERITIAQHLQAMLRDPVLADLWLRDVLHRIVGASLQGSADPAQRQFARRDLEPPEAVADAELLTPVQRALAYFASAEGRRRVLAAELLQELLGSALRGIFRFTEALGQRTLDEIVDDIRKQLLDDKKELVLLVEDLAALSGIQEPLLKILIAESEYAGERVRAPIRSAIAVTDGFLAGRSTVLTRAHEEWVVPSEVADEETVLRRLVSLSARYLNAARLGLPALRRAFREAANLDQSLYGWVPRFEDTHGLADSAQLEAFGFSEQHYSLFPFNVHAIRSLGAVALKGAGQWTYNPRAFINDVLRRTLDERAQFEKGCFPPAEFLSPRLDSRVAQQLEFGGYGPETTGRLRTALAHWAGAPASLDRAPIERAIFDVFGLPWPFQQTDGRRPISVGQPVLTPVAPPVTAPVGPPVATPVGPPMPAPRQASEYARAIESWTPRAHLIDVHARRTRVLLEQALNRRMDFDGLRLRRQKLKAASFWLPPARTVGNPTVGLAIRVAPADGEQIPTRVAAGLQALDRWDAAGCTWTYLGAEDDLASASALLDDLEAQAAAALTEEVERDAAVLAAALHRQNLVAGKASSATPQQASLPDLLAVLAESAKVPADQLERLPTAVRQALEARRRALAGREEFQERLKDFLCYFQGTGAVVLGVDTDRLRRIWKRTEGGRWTLAVGGHGRLREDAFDALERLCPDGIDGLVRQLGAALAHFQPRFARSFDDGFTRLSWREDLETTVNQAVERLWPSSIVEHTVRTAIDRLSAEGSEVVIGRVRRLAAGDSDEKPNAALARLGMVDLPRLVLLSAELDVLDGFLAALEQLVRQQTTVDDSQALAARDALIRSLVWEAA